jgi:hypothetical protein
MVCECERPSGCACKQDCEEGGGSGIGKHLLSRFNLRCVRAHRIDRMTIALCSMAISSHHWQFSCCSSSSSPSYSVFEFQVMRDNAPETVRDALRREIIQLIESSRRTEEGCAFYIFLYKKLDSHSLHCTNFMCLFLARFLHSFLKALSHDSVAYFSHFTVS